jgi:hypothetical protein
LSAKDQNRSDLKRRPVYVGREMHQVAWAGTVDGHGPPPSAAAVAVTAPVGPRPRRTARVCSVDGGVSRLRGVAPPTPCRWPDRVQVRRVSRIQRPSSAEWSNSDQRPEIQGPVAMDNPPVPGRGSVTPVPAGYDEVLQSCRTVLMFVGMKRRASCRCRGRVSATARLHRVVVRCSHSVGRVEGADDRRPLLDVAEGASPLIGSCGGDLCP